MSNLREQFEPEKQIFLSEVGPSSEGDLIIIKQTRSHKTSLPSKQWSPSTKDGLFISEIHVFLNEQYFALASHPTSTKKKKKRKKNGG